MRVRSTYLRAVAHCFEWVLIFGFSCRTTWKIILRTRSVKLAAMGYSTYDRRLRVRVCECERPSVDGSTHNKGWESVGGGCGMPEKIIRALFMYEVPCDLLLGCDTTLTKGRQVSSCDVLRVADRAAMVGSAAVMSWVFKDDERYVPQSCSSSMSLHLLTILLCQHSVTLPVSTASFYRAPLLKDLTRILGTPLG